MVYMLNELSMSKVGSDETVRKLLAQFVKAAVAAERLGFQELRLLDRILPDLFQMNLLDEYSIGTWLQDKRVDHDLRDRFRGIVTASPLIKEEELEAFELYSRSEFFKSIEGTHYQVWGLGAAHVYDSLAISLASHSEWGKTEVEINHHFLDQETNLKQVRAGVRNFSSAENLQAHQKWWDQRQKDALKDSAELWDKRHEFFSNIELCGEVERQLRQIGVSKEFSQIVDRLRALDRYAAEWKEGDFSYKNLNATTNVRVSPESNLTLQKYGSQRKFVIPGHGKEIFSLHIKTGDLRFHFYADNTAKKIYVGYIGKHLRIASED